MYLAFHPANPLLGNITKIMKKFLHLIIYCGIICNYRSLETIQMWVNIGLAEKFMVQHMAKLCTLKNLYNDLE